ncbi:MAG: hypothetical protein H0T47_15255 [Planctomycetaceae bacterium]|nr:hypothetical protein [Planctomycetaceae bacterium]
MKTFVLIAALLFFPLVILGTLAAMLHVQGREASRPKARRELMIVGGVIVFISIAVPLLLLWRAFP